MKKSGNYLRLIVRRTILADHDPRDYENLDTTEIGHIPTDTSINVNNSHHHSHNNNNNNHHLNSHHTPAYEVHSNEVSSTATTAINRESSSHRRGHLREGEEFHSDKMSNQEDLDGICGSSAVTSINRIEASSAVHRKVSQTSSKNSLKSSKSKKK